MVSYSVAGSTKLHNLMNKLKKWIKILEAKIKLLPKLVTLARPAVLSKHFPLNTII